MAGDHVTVPGGAVGVFPAGGARLLGRAVVVVDGGGARGDRGQALPVGAAARRALGVPLAPLAVGTVDVGAGAAARVRLADDDVAVSRHAVRVLPAGGGAVVVVDDGASMVGVRRLVCWCVGLLVCWPTGWSVGG